MITAVIVLDGRPLRQAMNVHLGFSAIQQAMNCVLEYALNLHRHHQHYHVEEFNHYLQQYYLELVETGRLHRVIDHETGDVNQAGWYEHYTEVACYIVEYYLAEILSALYCVSEQYGVSRLLVHRITPTHIVVTATCHLLIPDLRSSHEVYTHRRTSSGRTLRGGY